MITQARADTWLADLDSLYVALLETVTDGEAGTVGETAYTGYNRVQLSLGTVADALNGRQRTNDTALTYGTNTGSQVTIIGFGIFSLSSGGTLEYIVYLDGGNPSVFTALDTGDVFRAPSHGLINDDRARLMEVGAGSLPTGVSENTTYWVVGVSGDTFQLSTSQGGGAIALTADGAGIVMPLTPLNVPTNNAPQFAVGTLKVGLGTH